MTAAWRKTVLVLALGAAAGACAANQEGLGDPPAASGEETEVEVSNNHWANVTVYAVGRSARVRLGTVTSMHSRTFDLPATVGGHGAFRLVAHIIGSARTYGTDPILVADGDRVEWNLENKLALSSYTVRSSDGWE